MGVSELSHTAAKWIDGLSLGAFFGWFIGALPAVTLFFTAIWAFLKVGNELMERRRLKQEIEINARTLRGE